MPFTSRGIWETKTHRIAAGAASDVLGRCSHGILGARRSRNVLSLGLCGDVLHGGLRILLRGSVGVLLCKRNE